MTAAFGEVEEHFTGRGTRVLKTRADGFRSAAAGGAL